MKIAIVGCGLTGSLLADTFVAHIISADKTADITLIDHDEIAHRNSPGNLNIAVGAGTKKAAYIAQKIEQHGFDTKPLMMRLTKKNAGQLLKGTELVIGAVDNIDARVDIWNAAMELDVPYMDIGIHELGFNVSWTHNGTDTMQYSPARNKSKPDKMPNVEKQPPCTLVGSRIQAAIATECAMKSLMIFCYAHDPSAIVDAAIGREAEIGDMVGWSGISAAKENNFLPLYLGGA
jgi:molybdopterin/thiamine biosynthesis adenylyltransferase